MWVSVSLVYHSFVILLIFSFMAFIRPLLIIVFNWNLKVMLEIWIYGSTKPWKLEEKNDTPWSIHLCSFLSTLLVIPWNLHVDHFCRCTSNDLKMFVRLIKHDLRINAGAKHMWVLFTIMRGSCWNVNLRILVWIIFK